MAFHDARCFIAEAVESVLAQTLSDWELILVDDGSTDGSSHVATSYAGRFPGKIVVYEHPGRINRGIGPSRNLGIQRARGRYVAFLDADDVYEPRRLERHVQCLERDPRLGVVLSPDLYWYSWQAGVVRRFGDPDRVIGPAVQCNRPYDPPWLIVGTLLTEGAPMPAVCGVTARTAAAQSLGGTLDGFPGHYEDQVLICHLLISCRALVLPDCLARYRQRADSVTQGNRPGERVAGCDASLARGSFLEWLRGRVVQNGMELPELDDWICNELNKLSAVDDASRREQSPHAGSLAVRLAARVLPPTIAGVASRFKHHLYDRRMRRQVMRRIGAFEDHARRRRVGESVEGGHEAPAVQAIRRYWNERIHDIKLSDDAPGTAGFYAALDQYRLQKSPYLLQLVDFGAWAGRDVLEIGCGAGLDLVRFARGGARVTGVDVASTAIELARDCCRVADVSAELLEADGARLPFPDASFDLVYCTGLLPFAADPAAIVREAHRVLRPGGEAIFMAYNRRSWLRLMELVAGSRAGHGHADAPGFQLYTAAEFDRLLQPFAARRHVVERLPTATQRHSGLAGTVFNGVVVPMARALPDRWVRRYGGHLWAFCRKVPDTARCARSA